MAKKEYIDRRSLGIKCADPSAFINPAYAMGWNSAVKLIQNAPAADVAPVVHGKWLPTKNEFMGDECFECSNCGYTTIGCDYKYCSNCGAKMCEKEREENA